MKRVQGSQTSFSERCPASGSASPTTEQASCYTTNAKAVLMKKGEEGKPFSSGLFPPQQETRGITIKESSIINR